MYSELAAWWPLLSPVSDYEEEAAIYAGLLKAKANPKTVLELGSGGGNNAFYLKEHFEMTLCDISDGMLAESRRINPTCRHLEGDMRTLRLDETFDAVFIHDAIEHMASPGDLQQALQTAFLHCRPGGVALFVPDGTLESYENSSEIGGEDGDGRALRYVEWAHRDDPASRHYFVDFTLMMRTGTEPLVVETDRHHHYLFTHEEWLRAIEAAGFDVEAKSFRYEEIDASGIAFLAQRP